MPERRSDSLQLALIAAMLAAGLAVLLYLPPGARVPIHFDAAGTPDGWAGAGTGLFLMPGLAAAWWGLRRLLERIDPRSDNLLRSAAALDAIWATMAWLFAALQGLIVAAALGVQIPGANLGLVLVGAVMVAVGNVMGKLRPNHSVGIRTRWTLADERVWDQTHRFGGKASVLGGVALCALAALPAAPGWQGPAIVVVSLLVAGASVIKSCLLWRARHRPGG